MAGPQAAGMVQAIDEHLAGTNCLTHNARCQTLLASVCPGSYVESAPANQQGGENAATMAQNPIS
jgi:hypothetical protein